MDGIAQKSKDETKIKTTEKGTTYELIDWESHVVYNPFTFTWYAWEKPVIKEKKYKMTKMIPVSEFDRPPVFSAECLTAEDQMACSNEALREFIAERSIDYPEVAKMMGQEGMEYVTFTLNPSGECNGRRKAVTKDKPCIGCSDAAIDIVYSMEDMWYPAIKDGEKVQTELTIPVKFKLIEW